MSFTVHKNLLTSRFPVSGRRNTCLILAALPRRNFQSSNRANMPTVTLKDPKIPLTLPDDLAKDGGEEVKNFKPFKASVSSSRTLAHYVFSAEASRTK